MKLVTIQASAFKSTFEVLKDILNDVNIYFRPDGMYVVTLDTARTSLIDMYLSADNFEEYHCDQEEIIAGINISNTFKLLKTITNNDVLKMAINSKEYMDIEIISETKKTNSKFQLKLLDINESRIEVPDVEMTTITTLPQTFNVSVVTCLISGQTLRFVVNLKTFISSVKVTSPIRKPPLSVPMKVQKLQGCIV